MRTENSKLKTYRHRAFACLVLLALCAGPDAATASAQGQPFDRPPPPPPGAPPPYGRRPPPPGWQQGRPPPP
ncbi:MAG: hypothetical protein WBV39_17285, partial [Rudaea sp.]